MEEMIANLDGMHIIINGLLVNVRYVDTTNSKHLVDQVVFEAEAWYRDSAGELKNLGGRVALPREYVKRYPLALETQVFRLLGRVHRYMKAQGLKFPPVEVTADFDGFTQVC